MHSWCKERLTRSSLRVSARRLVHAELAALMTSNLTAADYPRTGGSIALMVGLSVVFALAGLWLFVTLIFSCTQCSCDDDCCPSIRLPVLRVLARRSTDKSAAGGATSTGEPGQTAQPFSDSPSVRVSSSGFADSSDAGERL